MVAQMEWLYLHYQNGFRPKEDIFSLCHGTGSNKWLLSVESGGNVNFQRYGTDSYVNANAGNWLPFTITFLTE